MRGRGTDFRRVSYALAGGLCVLALWLLLLGTFWSTSTLALRGHVFSSAFGSEGSGNGELIKPAGVAVNDFTEPLVEPAAGDVYVVDKGNDRVERFSSTGSYISQFNDERYSSR